MFEHTSRSSSDHTLEPTNEVAQVPSHACCFTEPEDGKSEEPC